VKLFKKAKDLFKKMTGQDDNLPPPSATTAELPVIAEPADPRYAYRHEQRDFEARAAATTVFWRDYTYRRNPEVDGYRKVGKKPGRMRGTLQATA
jgi:hypothetical protein